MKEYMEQAMAMVTAQANVKAMTPAEMIEEVKEVAEGLQKLFEGETEPEVTGFVVDPKKAIKEQSITCCECGWKGKVLTSKHLAKHGMTKAEYIEKYGYKKGQALCCKANSKMRKEQMAKNKIWTKVGKGKKAGTKKAAPKKVS